MASVKKFEVGGIYRADNLFDVTMQVVERSEKFVTVYYRSENKQIIIRRKIYMTYPSYHEAVETVYEEETKFDGSKTNAKIMADSMVNFEDLSNQKMNKAWTVEELEKIENDESGDLEEELGYNKYNVLHVYPQENERAAVCVDMTVEMEEPNAALRFFFKAYRQACKEGAIDARMIKEVDLKTNFKNFVDAETREWFNRDLQEIDSEAVIRESAGGKDNTDFRVENLGNNLYYICINVHTDEEDDLLELPIETAKVKEEVKMMTISKAKLEAYNNATNAENNRVTVYFNGNRKQFEVYGTYYVKRKVNCARGEKVCKEVEMVDWHKVSQKDVAEILKNYGLTIDEFVAIANGDYEEETAEVETTEVENGTKDEEVTAENSVNNNNKVADSDELLALKVRHTNLEIQRRKSGMKVGLERICDKQEEILQYTGKILEVEDVISNLTALILNDKLILDELQTKAAALENEIVNRKLIDAIDDIGGSAEAVDASVAAMEELNAANNFTAAKLLDAVNAADKAVENVPVTFELQNFTEDAVTAGGYATIDTAVSGTVIPVIDEDAEDAEIKNQLAKIAKLTNREKELEHQIAALQEELNAVHREYVKKDWNLTKYAKDLMDAVYQTVKTAFEKRTEWGCIEINGVMMQSWHWDEYNAVRTKFDDSGFALWFYDDTVPREYQYTEFVKYSTFKQFKAAISDLVSAIERGDKTFTFPADETADK